jgi:hypothetical protein
MFFDILKMWIVKVIDFTYRQKKTHKMSMFMDNYITKDYSMHSMSILNRFQDSYKVLEKNPRLCFLRKKKVQGFISNV